MILRTSDRKHNKNSPSSLHTTVLNFESLLNILL